MQETYFKTGHCRYCEYWDTRSGSCAAYESECPARQNADSRYDDVSEDDAMMMLNELFSEDEDDDLI